ncbi:hypothetical protein PsorP6_003899 [Peronosclerospora sorghi]|uniref:Uncharacterized protein n=2 Tax=Peronosclerospora sorghi TaxID=230839 RepID=A0ACC0VKQ4_9STRA|nr:hypothetical protein PsorP6_003898 [Peronosclerospora sorghi]KAI9907029.1 hypothetical protein PsorP6_003899 [Peronosclerospora sorghi]
MGQQFCFLVRNYCIKKEEVLRALQRVADILVRNFTISFRNEMLFMALQADFLRVLCIFRGRGGGVVICERLKNAPYTDGTSCKNIVQAQLQAREVASWTLRGIEVIIGIFAIDITKATPPLVFKLGYPRVSTVLVLLLRPTFHRTKAALVTQLARSAATRPFQTSTSFRTCSQQPLVLVLGPS